MNKYFKNFILCGDIDQYCLLCKETFHLITDIEKHIRWEQHRKNMKDLAYLPKFRKDFIYKIGSKYYCEVCNRLEANLTSLKHHIKCEKHISLKSNPDVELKKPVGLFKCGFVLIGRIILGTPQWNSIIDGKCRLCNVDVKNVEEHIALEEHMIKLIHCEAKYSDNQYYRKIDETINHCFACKSIFLATDLENHMQNCQDVEEVEVKKLKESEVKANIGGLTSKVCNIKDMEKEFLLTLTDYFIMNETTNVAVCKECSESIPGSFTSMLIHLKDFHNTPIPIASTSGSQTKPVESHPIVDRGKMRSDLAKYAKEHHIKLNFNASKGFCLICTKYMCASKVVFEEHCKGKIHEGHRELLGLKEPQTGRSLVEYATKSMESFMSGLQYTLKSRTVNINEEYYVHMEHFLLLFKIENDPHFVKTKCFVCNEIFHQGTESGHCVEQSHREKFAASLILNIPREFVREIRKNLYHCGFCNLTLPFPDALEIHLQSLKHKNARNSQKVAKKEGGAKSQKPWVTEYEKKYTQMLQSFCQSTKL